MSDLSTCIPSTRHLVSLSPASTILDDSETEGEPESSHEDDINVAGDELLDLLMTCSPTALIENEGRKPKYNRLLSKPAPIAPVVLDQVPALDMDELLEMYPLNDPNNGPCVTDTPPRAPKRILSCTEPSSEPSFSQPLDQELIRLKPAVVHILPMSLSARRLAMRQMVADMPDDIQPESHSRLNCVVSNPNVLLMYDKSAWGFIQTVVDAKRAFYIGITERPAERFESHEQAGFSQMALWIHADSPSSAAAERRLIRDFRSCHLMLNIGQGGERRSAATPHFLYVVVKKMFR